MGASCWGRGALPDHTHGSRHSCDSSSLEPPNGCMCPWNIRGQHHALCIAVPSLWCSLPLRSISHGAPRAITYISFHTGHLCPEPTCLLIIICVNPLSQRLWPEMPCSFLIPGAYSSLPKTWEWREQALERDRPEFKFWLCCVPAV